MTNRREVLQCAAALLALSPGLLAAVESREQIPLYKVLFDPRDGASTRFAAAFAEQGVGTFALKNGDITQFWRDELAPLWAGRAAPLAGLTDANILFCLEQLGRQFGMRVLQRDAQASGLVAWVIAGRQVPAHGIPPVRE